MYRKTTLIVMAVILSMLFITSCKKDNPTETTVKNLIVTVGEGLTPYYSWKDADGNPTNVYSLRVYKANDLDRHIWGIQTPSSDAYQDIHTWFADGIWSPVTHGIVQEGAERDGIADITPLPAGLTYRVKIQKTNGVQGYKDFSR